MTCGFYSTKLILKRKRQLENQKKKCLIHAEWPAQGSELLFQKSRRPEKKCYNGHTKSVIHSKCACLQMNAFNSPKCSTVHCLSQDKNHIHLNNSYCLACTLERSLRGTCRRMFAKTESSFLPFNASVQLSRGSFIGGAIQRPDSRPIVNTSTHILLPEALLSSGFTSRHPQPVNWCPLPPWPPIPRGPGAMVLPTPSLAALPSPSTPSPLDFPQKHVTLHHPL